MRETSAVPLARPVPRRSPLVSRRCAQPEVRQTVPLAPAGSGGRSARRRDGVQRERRGDGLSLGLGGALVVALLVGARDHRPRLGAAVHEERGAALGAGLLDGLLPELEVALDGFVRVVRAAVERAPAALLRADLEEVAAALGAGHADGDGTRVLARGVARARDELAESPGLDDHGLAALVACDARLARGCAGEGAVAARAEVARVLA